MKLTKLYTRTGDDGTTSLVGGQRVNKTNARIEAYGTIDELSSHLGLLAAFITDEARHTAAEYHPQGIETVARPVAQADTEQTLAEIEEVQRALFAIGSFLAIDQQTTPLYEGCCVREEQVLWLEKRIDAVQQAAGNISGFLLPGGTLAASQAHVCRTVCRRAERRIYAIEHGEETGWDTATQYVNRLSDYLFALSRKLNAQSGIGDKLYR